MIIEVFTAYTAVQITWETLEILHLLHVGYETGKHGYKVGSSIADSLQQRMKERKYEKDPALQLVYEAKTDYDFQATHDVDLAIQNHNKYVEDYLFKLGNGFEILNEAKRFFLEVRHYLEGMVNALKFKDEKKFFSQLSKFKIKFESFRDKGKEFSLLQIKAPDREQFYIASLSIGEEESIKKFNDYLKNINDCFKVLEETKAKIIVLFKDDLRVTSSLSSEENSSSEFSFESLKQKIRKCIDEPELIEETMQKILPKNSELARLCTEISQISTAFKKVNKTDTDNEQTNLWNNGPNWLPLLTEEEQIKFGQSIFLHAMNANYSGAEKLTFAQIFLKQHVSQHELNQMTIELLTHRLSTLLIVEQIKKCEKLIQFLSQLTEEAVLPEHDPYELLEWLKVTRHTVNSVECWIRILVSPYCLSKYHIESLPTKLGSLLPYENTDELIEQYRASHWGTIREKSEQLIQFPESFKTKIPPDERFQDDEQSKDSNRVTSLMSKLSKMLINELQALKREVLLKNRKDLNDGISIFSKKENEARNRIKNLEHENSVWRIKEAHRYVFSIEHPTNNLNSYLLNPKAINNELEKERQVPTVDDLMQVIYRGVNLNGVCKCKGDPNSNTNLLIDYFYPEQQEDSKIEAFTYAVSHCQINAWPLLHLCSNNKPLLAIENGNKDEKKSSLNPALVIILKNSKKISVPFNSMALNNVSPTVKEQTEIFINQLGNYYNLSYMRLKPELRKELPLIEKFKLLTQSLFNVGHKMREERFESVRIIMGNLQAVVSAETIKSINDAIEALKTNYKNRYKIAKRKYNSTLFTLTEKAINGCISEMNCLSESEREQLELEQEKAKVESLQESLNAVTLEKETLDVQLSEVKAERAQDKADFEAKSKALEADSEAKLKALKADFEAKLKTLKAERTQDKADFEARLKALETRLSADSSQQQGTSTPAPTLTEDQAGSSNNVLFFKH